VTSPRKPKQRRSLTKDAKKEGPESSAVRVALWRALHVEIDPPPHVLEDDVGLRLLDPDESWRKRQDMDPRSTRGYRAGIVARARFIEDLVAEQVSRGVSQYVILGAGLDSFAQRRPELASRLQVFEADKSGPQAWKRRRLAELGFAVPDWLHLVPVDFEGPWWQQLMNAGFEVRRRAVVASTGVAMYLTLDANLAALRQLATLAQGSTLAMSFMLPLELIDASERRQLEAVQQGARAAGTPFLSSFAPTEMLALARQAGFAQGQCFSAADLTERYFRGRADGLRPSSGEAILVATR
jgi:methyltransferase (TIGR00027 family)